MYSHKVSDFVKACGEGAPYPQIFSKEDINFLQKMVDDEFSEFYKARNEIEQADALVDIIYYVVHAAVKKGYDLDPIFDIVHNANMKKVVEGKVIRRDDGKILKPEGWTSPEPFIKKEIHRQLSRRQPFLDMGN